MYRQSGRETGKELVLSKTPSSRKSKMTKYPVSSLQEGIQPTKQTNICRSHNTHDVASDVKDEKREKNGKNDTKFYEPLKATFSKIYIKRLNYKEMRSHQIKILASTKTHPRGL